MHYMVQITYITSVLQLGVPEWIVKLRHDATHGILPSMDLLKTAADWCMEWLKVFLLFITD